MTVFHQEAVRWEPVPNIPETPCADFTFESYETGRLRLLLRYSWIRGNQSDLVLDFAGVRAIGTFWDGDGDHPKYESAPRCSGVHGAYLWPLLEIGGSHWLGSGNFAASIAIAEVCGEEPWRHYRILTLERSLDLLARGPISGRWVSGVMPT
jgi:hypothetical protein